MAKKPEIHIKDIVNIFLYLSAFPVILPCKIFDKNNLFIALKF